MYSDLRGDQARQTIDVEQILAAYWDVEHEARHRFAGSMAWKTVRGRSYLYRKRGTAWRSLGLRSPQTEAAAHGFHEGRAAAREHLASLAGRLDEMAPVNRALRLGRVPLPAARALRALGRAGLAGPAITLVGTNALFAYERMAGVQIESGHLATGDVDLLFDARARLDLAGSEVAASGLIGILRKVDRSYAPTGPGSFRAVNRDGYLVDLIQPTPSPPMTTARRSRIGSDATDLQAVEIEGLAWLVNSPKAVAVAIDDRGYPLRLVVPDPRVFALHKLWVSRRTDRDPLQRRRDRAQAELVARLLAERLPHLRFDDPVLSAAPAALRGLADDLGASTPIIRSAKRATEPDW